MKTTWLGVMAVTVAGALCVAPALADQPACCMASGTSTNVCKVCPKCGQAQCVCKSKVKGKDKKTSKGTLAAGTNAPAASDMAPAEDVNVPAGPGGEVGAPEAPGGDGDVPAPEGDAQQDK